MESSFKYLKKYENISDLDSIVYSNHRVINEQKDLVLIKINNLSNYAVEDHFHDWLEFTYIIDGETSININSRHYLLSSGDFIMIDYNLIHASKTPNNCKKVTFQIKRSFLEHHVPEFYASNIDCNSTNISSVEAYYKYKTISSIFLEMIDKFNMNDDINKIGFKGFFYHFIYLLMKDFSVDNTINHAKIPKSGEVVNHVMSYIHKNYASGLTLNDLSEVFHVSPQYISKVFKENCGLTFKEFLNEARLNHAVYEMINSDKSLLDICYECGFTNNKSFIYAFKLKYQMTPQKYRKIYK